MAGPVQSNVSMLPQGIEAVQFQLPMSYDYLESKFYVRKCYSEYYDYIESLLSNQKVKYVSLTGTLGIGKSIFYLYFFQRYWRENPTKTIVTAAFDKLRKFKKCIVFAPNSRPQVHLDGIPFIEDSIHFYDGPPDLEPCDNKMVCFTSPNYYWLDKMEKAEYHVELYFPVWTLEELWEANELLEIGLDSKIIKERFLLFGGSARYCLTLNNRFYDKGVNQLESKSRAITSFDDIKDCLVVKPKISNVIHRIFNYVPLYYEHDGMPSSFQPVFCSVTIARIVYASIREKSESKRSEFANWLKKFYAIFGWLFEGFDNDKLKIGLGWLFEGYATEKLKAGGDFRLKSLNSKKDYWLLSQ